MTSSEGSMLRIENVVKVYERPGPLLRLIVRTASPEPVMALDGLDFEVGRGEIVGLVGPNGAGKSTLIRICSSLLTPTSGRVMLDGVDVTHGAPSVRASIGLLLTDERAFYWRLTGRENLRFFGVMAGLTRRRAQDRADELLEYFDLARRDRRVFGYSSGMRVRLGLARALIAEPDVLILDEPSRSLDPVASEELQATMLQLADGGVAIMLASHRLDEVVACCDRIVVLVAGRQRAIFAPGRAIGTEAEDIKALVRLMDGEVEA